MSFHFHPIKSCFISFYKFMDLNPKVIIFFSSHATIYSREFPFYMLCHIIRSIVVSRKYTDGVRYCLIQNNTQKICMHRCITEQQTTRPFLAAFYFPIVGKIPFSSLPSQKMEYRVNVSNMEYNFHTKLPATMPSWQTKPHAQRHFPLTKKPHQE